MRSSRPIPFFFLFTGLLLFGCGATAAPSAPEPTMAPMAPIAPKPARPDAEGRFTLAVAGQAEVAPGLVLRLERVVADSRCPVDVNCVWAGEIRLAFALEAPQGGPPRVEFELATTAPMAELQGLRFELLGATPEARSTRKLAAADYSIALRVRTAAAEARQ